jgi:hypothetical protein
MSNRYPEFKGLGHEALQLGCGLQRLASVGPIGWSACGASVCSAMEKKDKKYNRFKEHIRFL